MDTSDTTTKFKVGVFTFTKHPDWTPELYVVTDYKLKDPELVLISEIVELELELIPKVVQDSSRLLKLREVKAELVNRHLAQLNEVNDQIKQLEALPRQEETQVAESQDVARSANDDAEIPF